MGAAAIGLRGDLTLDTPARSVIETFRRVKSPAAIVTLGAAPAISQANAAFVEAVGLKCGDLGAHPLCWAEPTSALKARQGFDNAATLRVEWSGILMAQGDRPHAFAAQLLPLCQTDGSARHALLRLTDGQEAGCPVGRPAPGRAGELAPSAACMPGSELRGDIEARDLSGHARAIKAMRLLSDMVSQEAPKVRERRGRVALARLKERIGALTHALELLADGNTSLGDIVERLCERLADDVLVPEAQMDIEFRLSIEDMPVGSERLVMLMLVLHELIGNALRHAFEGRGRGTVAVRLYRVDDIMRLYVEDDGCGLPDDTFVKETFGFDTVEGLVRQAGGMMVVTAKQGTSVMVRLPAE